MSLNSPEFIIFLSAVLVAYFLVPPRIRWIILFVASYLFAAIWNIQSILVLFLSTLLNYMLAISIANTSMIERKQQLLFLDIGLNLGLLVIFRYVGVDIGAMASAISRSSNSVQAVWTVTQTVGISFYTFQQISYNIDVYRSVIKPEKHFGIYAVFVALFPHLLAGPIDRAAVLLPQLRASKSFSDIQAVEGFRLILWGAFKKIVVADRLALYVNTVYQTPQNYSNTVLVVATIFYTFQIYTDFSGYSDIAIGAAKVLGFQLTNNFKQPYLSTSIREFWQRWHISLSSWIRDYLFFPLARKSIRITQGKWQRITQLTISIFVMGLVGLWHGSQLTFIVWGFLHGIYLGLEAIFRMIRVPIHTSVAHGIKLVFTFILICFAWIFFRSNSITDALYIATHVWDVRHFSLQGVTVTYSAWEFALACALIGIIIGVDVLDNRWGLNTVLDRIPSPVRWGLYYGVTAIIVLFGVWGAPLFIYFRF